MKKTREALESFIDEYNNNIGEVEERLDEVISFQLESLLSQIYCAVESCQTPIEKILAIYLEEYANRSKLHFLGDVFEIEPQAEIEINDKKYKVDFLVKFLKEENLIDHEFVIECDGHDFHEKTKEQVKKDKERERNLMENGYVVIRFTGSEIYDSPARCARQALRIIENFIIKKYKK